MYIWHLPKDKFCRLINKKQAYHKLCYDKFAEGSSEVSCHTDGAKVTRLEST